MASDCGNAARFSGFRGRREGANKGVVSRSVLRFVAPRGRNVGKQIFPQSFRHKISGVQMQMQAVGGPVLGNARAAAWHLGGAGSFALPPGRSGFETRWESTCERPAPHTESGVPALAPWRGFSPEAAMDQQKRLGRQVTSAGAAGRRTRIAALRTQTVWRQDRRCRVWRQIPAAESKLIQIPEMRTRSVAVRAGTAVVDSRTHAAMLPRQLTWFASLACDVLATRGGRKICAERAL